MKNPSVSLALFLLASNAGLLDATTPAPDISPPDLRRGVLEDSREVLHPQLPDTAASKTLRDPFQPIGNHNWEEVLQTCWTSFNASRVLIKKSGPALITADGEILVGHMQMVPVAEKHYPVFVKDINALSVTLECEGGSRSFPVPPPPDNPTEAIKRYGESLLITGYLKKNKRPRLLTENGILTIGHKAKFMLGEKPYHISITAISPHFCTFECQGVSVRMAWQKP